MVTRPLQAPGDSRPAGAPFAKVSLQDAAAIPPILGMLSALFFWVRKAMSDRKKKRDEDSQRIANIEAMCKTLVESDQALALDAQVTKETFRIMLDGVQVPLWIANGSGSVIVANQAFSSMFGRPPGDMMGDGWQGLVDQDEQDGVSRRWRQAVADGQPIACEFDHRGERIRMTGNVIKEPGGKPFRFIGSARVVGSAG